MEEPQLCKFIQANHAARHHLIDEDTRLSTERPQSKQKEAMT